MIRYKGSPSKQYLNGKPMSATVEGLDDAITILKAVAQNIPGKMEKLLDELVTVGVERAKQEVPVDTGELRDSIHGERSENEGRIIANTDHALFVEFGTGVRGRATAPFDADEVGYIYDIHERDWQGNVANPFMHRTAEFIREELSIRGSQLLKEVIEEAKK